MTEHLAGCLAQTQEQPRLAVMPRLTRHPLPFVGDSRFRGNDVTRYIKPLTF
ncbi:MAG: hypothetical protein LBE35_02875 [Clostridiales bacterium]|nr:hypothetical protein [Clostridiales bacterium]